jgi:ribosomal protein L44E
MKTIFVVVLTAILAGCGVDTATSAATAGSIKKQELQEGQRTMQRAQERIEGAAQQMQQRANTAATD